MKFNQINTVKLKYRDKVPYLNLIDKWKTYKRKKMI